MVQWDQTEYERFVAGLSPERRARDEADLAQLFARARQVPACAEALDWAEQHGVKFLIDRKLPGHANGYYAGDGIVVLCEAILRGAGPVRLRVDVGGAQPVITLTHELRHAWQDYAGLLHAPAAGYAYLAIGDALTEADASAYGALAEWQYAQRRAGGFSRDENGRALARGFTQWFASFRPRAYGNDLSDDYAFKNGLVAQKPAGLDWRDGVEYTAALAAEHPAAGGKLNYDDLETIRLLGTGFNRVGNYFNTHLSPDFLSKTVLRPSLARTFWERATPQETARLSAIRKLDLKRKLTLG